MVGIKKYERIVKHDEIINYWIKYEDITFLEDNHVFNFEDTEHKSYDSLSRHWQNPNFL